MYVHTVSVFGPEVVLKVSYWLTNSMFTLANGK